MNDGDLKHKLSSQRMETPFKNDIFALIWKSFKNLYPKKECECLWETYIREDENGQEVFGLTDFGDDGSVVVFVRADLRVTDAGEILAHELARVAVGVDHDHDEAWEEAFEAIFNEYHRIGNEIFGDFETDEGGLA